MRAMVQRTRATLAAAVLAACALGAAAAPSYRVTALPLSDHDNAHCAVSSLNDAAQVVMICGFAFGKLKLWSATAGLQTLTDPSRPNAQYSDGAINNAGIVAGVSTSTTGEQLFTWDPGRGFQYAGAGNEHWFVSGINDLNEVFGQMTASGPYRPFVWSPTTGVQLMPHAHGRDESLSDRNNRGQSVGDYSSRKMPGGTYGRSRAIKFDADGAASGPFPVAQNKHMDSGLTTLNNTGQAAGVLIRDGAVDTKTKAFLWQADGSIRYLGEELPNPNVDSYSKDLNDAGQGVGWNNDIAYVPFFAFYWDNGTPAGPLLALIDPADPLFGKISFDYGDYGVIRINASGQIAINGFQGSRPRKFLLTPQ
jgi:hypothetical protein